MHHSERALFSHSGFLENQRNSKKDNLVDSWNRNFFLLWFVLSPRSVYNGVNSDSFLHFLRLLLTLRRLLSEKIAFCDMW